MLRIRLFVLVHDECLRHEGSIQRLIFVLVRRQSWVLDEHRRLHFDIEERRLRISFVRQWLDWRARSIQWDVVRNREVRVQLSYELFHSILTKKKLSKNKKVNYRLTRSRRTRSSSSSALRRPKRFSDELSRSRVEPCALCSSMRRSWASLTLSWSFFKWFSSSLLIFFNDS